MWFDVILIFLAALGVYMVMGINTAAFEIAAELRRLRGDLEQGRTDMRNAIRDAKSDLVKALTPEPPNAFGWTNEDVKRWGLGGGNPPKK